MTSQLQKIVTPNGETLVVLPEAEYEALLDAVDVAEAKRVLTEISEGRQEWVPAEIVDRLLDGENRIRVWREHRGLTQDALASEAQIDATALADFETGKASPGLGILRKLATALNVDIDDLVP